MAEKKANWSPDTANSYAELFKRFLNFYLPDIFPRKEGNDRDNIRLKTEYTKNLLSELIIHSTYKKLKECHKNIAYDNQLILYSHLIFFQEELFRQLEDNCDKDALQSMQDFAKLTHTPGNFILVRPGENFVKNNRYGDFIDLYIEDQNENFIKGQHLGMYNEPLFRRRGYQVFPDKKSLMTCVDNINKKIIQREKELNR
ncbi:hypothetical protein [Bacillus sp. JCM 19034]|uniref:hypothetical protein n=1 Tax=Bacillus sp. JCM 19034 TaxID=1481928 RepID=UPI0012E13605|nr:hypothetical protein [Bacillus sp. JCM 19034]